MAEANVAQQQVGKKRPLTTDDDDAAVEPAAKKTKSESGAPVPSASLMQAAASATDASKAADATTAANGAADEIPAITEEKDPYMFYPENYATFDPECLMVDGEPVKSKVGGGTMVFIKYKWPDGTLKNFCAQGPKMFLPGGIQEYREEGKAKVNTSALASLGREYESNPQMVAFKNFCYQVQCAMARIIVNKMLHVPYCQNIEDVLACFSPICEASTKEDKNDPTKMIDYPPAIKLIVNTAPTNMTMFVTQIMSTEGPMYARIEHSRVEKGSSIIPMIRFDWIYRKKISNPKAGWAYSAHTSIYQAVIGAASSVGTGISSRLVVVS